MIVAFMLGLVIGYLWGVKNICKDMDYKLKEIVKMINK